MKSELSELTLASIVIPFYNRYNELERTYKSVLKSKGIESCEIILIDDCSTEGKLNFKLREQDTLIKLDHNSGAAIARNKGIEKAKGEVIFLLDSDDIFNSKNIIKAAKKAINLNALCYTSIRSQAFISNYPQKVTRKTFIHDVLYSHPYLCQTSSLFFPRKLDLKFDEELPKHQDWDFVLSTILKNIKVCHVDDGYTFFDRSDRNSLSRRRNPNKSKPWLKKVQSLLSKDEYELIEYCIMGSYRSEFSWINFFSIQKKLITLKIFNFYFFLKHLYRRILN